MSRRASLIALLACALFATFATGCGPPPPQRQSAALARYPRSPALDAVAATHREAAHDRDDLVLLTTWFLDGDPRVAMMCRVRADGHLTSFRYRQFGGDSSIQPGKSIELVPDQMSELREQLEHLPVPQTPAMGDLLLISYRQGGPGGEWVTRTYDRYAMPPPAAALFLITGAPIDPALKQ